MMTEDREKIRAEVRRQLAMVRVEFWKRCAEELNTDFFAPFLTEEFVKGERKSDG